MRNSAPDQDICIIGAGPVGLYLAGLLGSMDFTVTVLEQKTSIDHHSKSLGIHPVSLELFDDIGIADRFTEAGQPIKKGHAFIDHKKMGTISFDTCPKPFNYILALPQYRTEEILEEWCQTIDHVTIHRGAALASFSEESEHVDISYSIGGSNETIRSNHLVGCDGKNSTARELAGIHFQGNSYPDTYIMGDYSDNTDFELP